MSIDLTMVVEAIIGVCVILMTTFVLPWIKKKAGAEETSEFLAWVKIAVTAAEQIYDVSRGTEKKAYVVRFLESKGFEVDYEVIDNAIEAAVLELHKELYGGETHGTDPA